MWHSIICIMFYLKMHCLQQIQITYVYRYIPEKAMATHSGTLAWKIPWTEEPGRLQSMGSLGVGHDWTTSLSLFTFLHWRRKWQPTPVFLPGESQGWGAWWAAVYGVAQSRTRLKWLCSSSSSMISFALHKWKRKLLNTWRDKLFFILLVSCQFLSS